MAQLNHFPRAIAACQICVFCGCFLASGCSDTTSQADLGGAAFVRVLYEGQPLADVQVRLHESQGGPVLAQSISRRDGNAYFRELASPEPPRYVVTVESLSDGGWMLDAKACQKLSQSISLEPLESSPAQRIEIPRGAVQTLSSSKRR